MTRRDTARNWRFSISVMVPVILAIAVTVGTAALFILWSANKSDERALERQTRLVAHAIGQQLADLEEDQQDVAGWDDAVRALRSPIDKEWLDMNYGVDGYEYLGLNRVYVITSSLNPVYAAREGQSVSLESFNTDLDALAPLLQKLFSSSFRGAIAAYKSGSSSTLPQVGDVAILAGRPALISIAPILSSSGDLYQPADRDDFHIAISFLDGSRAAELMDQYFLQGAHFDLLPSTLPAETLYPVQNVAGRFVAYFKWIPDRPGAQLIADTLPTMLAALLVAGAIIALLLRGLARSSLELETARRDAHHRSLHDPLTGLANRAFLADRMRVELAALSRGQLPLALLILDLDRFKQVNDTLGHEAGDQLLLQVADRIRPLLHEGDTFARLGGDEFAILVPLVKSNSDLAALGARIIEAIGTPFELNGRPASIGISIGAALARSATHGDDLSARADFALYQAKDSGRNCFRMFDERRAQPEFSDARSLAARQQHHLEPHLALP